MKKNLNYILGMSVSLIVGMVVMPWILFQLQDNFPWSRPIIDFLIAIRPFIISISGLVGGVSGLLLIVVNNKERRALSVITEAAKSDVDWDADGLRRFCRLCFYKLHYAWCKDDRQSLTALVTDDFLNEMSYWNQPPLEFQNDLINTIEITDTNIISGVDSIDNRQDQYAVLLQGNYIYPVYPDSNLTDTVEKMPFKIICNFTRINGSWKLCGVDDAVNIIKILLSKSVIKEQDRR